jgi:hypothetical protein
MRFFPLLDFQHFVIALFLGLAAALVVYLAFRYMGNRRREQDDGGEEVEASSEYPEGLEVGDNPMPPVLIFIFLGFVVWFVFYVVIFGILGGPV